ncbi:putative heme/steroid binding domain protein [Aspergillus foveolatus]|uniref:putative heme/steroid binding domain protein n=1 Tax=Aspergillus foveolatus TaxID=210207 RepID=UPI003CCE0EED
MMSELRQRAGGPKDAPRSSTTTAKDRGNDAQSRTRSGISILDIFRVILTLAVVSCGLSYYLTETVTWGYNPWFTNWSQLVRYVKGPIALTPSELSLYDGTNPDRPIYVAVNGTIFDVSANPRMYGPGGGYHFFAGRDATRAFVTGCFAEDLTDDLTGVEEMFIQDMRNAKKRVEKQIAHWVGFFGKHQKYFEVGRVVKDGTEDEMKGKRDLCEAARKQRPKREKSTSA